MESPDYVSHGRDATVSGRSVRVGTNEGTPDHRSAMGTHGLSVVPSQKCTGTMKSADYVSHGRDAAVSGRSVREGTVEGTSDDTAARGTHSLRVVPSQQCTGTMKSPDYVSHWRDATVSGRSVRESTDEGTSDDTAARGTHSLRVVPSQQPQNSRSEHPTTCKCVILSSCRAERGLDALTQPSNPRGVSLSMHSANPAPSLSIAPCVRIQRRFARFGGWSLTVQHSAGPSVNCGGRVSSLTTIKLRGRLTVQVWA